MPHGSVRSGLALVVGALFLAACDAESPTSPATATAEATAEAIDAPSLAVASTSAAKAVLPRTTVSTAQATSTGRIITVRSGGNLQSAIDNARPGDVIQLQAGATFKGNFTLRKKSGTGWVTIRSSSHASLPSPGNRVAPSHASLMPKIVSPNGGAALRTAAGAHHYRITGVEITTATTGTSATQLVSLGSGSRTAQASLSSVPNNIIIDRSYIHGRSNLNLKNCVELHSAHTAIVDSYLSMCHSASQESHAIIGWNGPGPFLIENNYIAGAGINVMFGGADPASESLMPADITIRRNHVVKPTTWQGKWLVKNLFELKLGRRVLVEGNVFENNWNGFAINLKSVNQGGRAPFSQTADVTFRHNVVRNVAHAVSLHGRPESRTAVPAARLNFSHNSFERVGTGDFRGGRVFQVAYVQGLILDHNTGFGTSNALILHSSRKSTNLVMTNNILGTGSSLITSADGKGAGIKGLDAHVSGWTVRDNVLIGARSSTHPSGNKYPARITDVGTLSSSGTFTPRSTYQEYGTDRTALTSQTARVVR